MVPDFDITDFKIALLRLDKGLTVKYDTNRDCLQKLLLETEKVKGKL
jgi:hypothetical protein